MIGCGELPLSLSLPLPLSLTLALPLSLSLALALTLSLALALPLALALALPLALSLTMIGVSITRTNAWGRSLDELKRGADRVPVPVLLLVLVLLVVLLRLRGRSRGMVGCESPYHRYRPSRDSKMNHTPLSPSPFLFLFPWA